MAVIIISLAFLNIGYFYNEWTILWDHYPWIYSDGGRVEVDLSKKDDMALAVTLINTCVASVTCLVVGTFSHYNRRNYLIAANLIAIASSAIMMIKSYPWLVIGRILRGIVTGIVSVIVPLLLNEIMNPIQKISGLAFMQIWLTFGPVFVYTVALLTPQVIVPNEDEPNVDFWFSVREKHVPWRILFAIPIVPSLVQLLLLLFVVKSDKTELGKFWDILFVI